MARAKIWLLPAALAAAQAVVWPGVPLALSQPLDPVRTTALLVVILVVTAALSLRMARPVVALAGSAAALTTGGLIAPEQLFVTSGDTLMVLSIADLIALFSVAVRCSRRTTALALAALSLWLTATTLLTATDPLDIPAGILIFVIVAAGGRIRRRWTADRAAAARRLAEAEQARRDAADAERRRLARELHDVTAHHLTSIVVQAQAATFLADQNPTLRAEALAFAARTGHEALADLRRLVAVLPTPATSAPGHAASSIPSLADLADDFRHLGQVVVLETAGEPLPEAVADAVHGIAREALTNTLRYAPGATVRVRLTHRPGTGAALPAGPSANSGPSPTSGTELIIEDDGPAAAVSGFAGPVGSRALTDLGGGRGLTGMSDRAAALGGTVRAGARAEGGWRVHAFLPAAAPPPRRGAFLRSQAVLDGALALLALVLPLAGVLTYAEETSASPAHTALLVLAVAAHAAPLLWRRRLPWTVLAAVTLTTWLGPLLVLIGAVRTDDGYLFLFSIGADLAAVYAVAARGARPALTWLAPLATLASTSLALAVLVALAPPADGEPTPLPIMVAVMTVVITAVLALLLALPVLAFFLAGHATRRRRERRLAHEHNAVAHATTQAEHRARDERARIAAGLHTAVLTHAARVPQAAEAGDLPGVLHAGREALAAMRSMLDTLGPVKPTPGTEPPPAATHQPPPDPAQPGAAAEPLPAAAHQPPPTAAQPPSGAIRRPPVAAQQSPAEPRPGPDGGPESVREEEVPSSESA
jgi:signal transduction histidine kinase